MQSDDIMPNDGTYFMPREPKDQALARKKEQADTLESAGVLRELIAQFKDDIAFYGSVDSIPPEVKTDPQQFLIVYNANELVRNALQAKKDWVESLLELHARDR